MTPLELAHAAAVAADDKSATDVVVLDVSKIIGIVQHPTRRRDRG